MHYFTSKSEQVDKTSKLRTAEHRHLTAENEQYETPSAEEVDEAENGMKHREEALSIQELNKTTERVEEICQESKNDK